jgi:hypothetical protein
MQSPVAKNLALEGRRMTTRYPTLIVQTPPLSQSLRAGVLRKLTPSRCRSTRNQPLISYTFSLASNPLEASFPQMEKKLGLKSASYARMYGLSGIYSVFLRQAATNTAPISLRSPRMFRILSTGQKPETQISEGISTMYTLRSTTIRFWGISGDTS